MRDRVDASVTRSPAPTPATWRNMIMRLPDSSTTTFVLWDRTTRQLRLAEVLMPIPAPAFAPIRALAGSASMLGNEVPVEYLLFEDEGHFLVNRENRIALQEAGLSFLESHLR
jgi:hypothetical protein